MAIEFRCTSCNKLLRTGDGTAGKQAKCPECGSIMTIPAAAPSGYIPPPPPPPSGVYSPQAAQPSSRPVRNIVPSLLDIGDVFGRTWTIIKPNWGNCLGVIVIVWLISMGVSLASNFIPILGGLISMAFQIWLDIGLKLYFLKTARGERVEMGEIFTGWPYFWKILLANILFGLILFGIILVCVLPLGLIGLLISPEAALTFAIVGFLIALAALIYVSLLLAQYYYLILDRNVDVIDSFKMSMELMEGNKLTLFCIGLLSFFISVAAIIPLLLGLLFTIPFFFLMQPIIYLIITGQPTADKMRQPEMRQDLYAQ